MHTYHTEYSRDRFQKHKIFYFLKAGKLVTFISTPVMGGFISGIALTIILMQIPKIMGGKSGSGELPELLKHLYETAQHINWVSVALGVGALAILIIYKNHSYHSVFFQLP